MTRKVMAKHGSAMKAAWKEGEAVAYYYNGAGQRYILPERPLEPPDVNEPEPPDEGLLLQAFAAEYPGEFIEFVAGFDMEILDDFAEQYRWLWKPFKEEHNG